jgi:uncharacterized OB-fold protein
LTEVSARPRYQLNREVPEVRGEEATYFDYCRRGELRIQRCRSCSSFVFYPRAVCPTCTSDELDWVQARGTGTVHTFTVQHRDLPGFEGQAPFVVAIIELEEGVRLMSQVMGEPDDVSVGMAVRVEFASIGDSFQVPVFVPADAAHA